MDEGDGRDKGREERRRGKRGVSVAKLVAVAIAVVFVRLSTYDTAY